MRSNLIENLRTRIRGIERVPVSLSSPSANHGMGFARPACTPTPWTFGIVEIDHALPWGGLEPSGLHEIQPRTHADSWAALGFALGLLARRMAATGAARKNSSLWAFTPNAAHEFGRPYGPGLHAFGIDPSELLMVETRRAADLAWTLEEGLKARALVAVLGQIDGANWTLGRRLALAAQAHRTPCLLISSPGTCELGAAMTRWRIETAPSSPHPFDASAPGARRWQATLERCRWGPTGLTWNLEWSDDAYRFRLAAPLADRVDNPGWRLQRTA
jgi:protein ImuA